MEKPLQPMLEVSSTMLITLNARAIESASRDPIIRDPKAEEMIGVIKEEISGSRNPIHRKILNKSYNRKLGVTMALRSRRFDRYVTDFLETNPEGTIINFGCGLDTRFDRIDNGKVTWYDLDFPEVIELRRRFLQESSRRKFIPGSILEPGWVKKVKNQGPYLFLAEGVFMYLKEEDVKGLLSLIRDEFVPADVVCEVTNRYWVDRMKSRYMKYKFNRQLGMTGGAVFSYGVRDSREFEKWSPDYHFLDEWTYFDDREKKLGWFNWFAKIELLRKVQWTVHYQIG